MQLHTIVLFVCLVVLAVQAHALAVQAHAQAPAYDTLTLDDQAAEDLQNVPVHERSLRTKRGLFLLKKKLLLGALGLKAVKIGAVGVAGALALKKAKSAHSFGGSSQGSYSYQSSYPEWYVKVHSW